MPRALEDGPLKAALEALDQVLLIFAFAGLLRTIIIVVVERGIRAELSPIVGLIVVVRGALA